MVIYKSKSFDQKLWLRLKRLGNICIYGFKRFHTDFFKTGGDIIYKDILKLVQLEELFQVEKVFKIVKRKMSGEIIIEDLYLSDILEQYLEIKDVLLNKDIVVNQRFEKLT